MIYKRAISMALLNYVRVSFGDSSPFHLDFKKPADAAPGSLIFALSKLRRLCSHCSFAWFGMSSTTT